MTESNEGRESAKMAKQTKYQFTDVYGTTSGVTSANDKDRLADHNTNLCTTHSNHSSDKN